MILSGDEPVFIHRRVQTGVDEYGNPEFEKQQVLVRNCLIGFGATNEPTLVDANPVDSVLTVYMPPETQILDGDEFEIREKMWVKDGDPHDWKSPFPDFVPGVIVMVRRRRG